ncbi:hypothetical protein ACWFR5_35450 [Streptomyces sp. NPDC055092]
MAIPQQRTRRGQGLWLALVGSASIVLVLISAAQVQGSIADLLPVIAGVSVVPGVLALAQSLLLRTGHLDPAMIGVAALSGPMIGLNSGGGNGRMLLGVLLALAMAVPFALLSGYLTLSTGLGYAVVSAAAVLLGTDQLVSLIVGREAKNVAAPLMRAMAKTELWLPNTVLIAAAAFALVGVLRSAQEARLHSGSTSGWIRPTLLVFLPAFSLSVLAGMLYTVQLRAVLPQGLGGSGYMASCLLVLTAGGCSLKAGEANIIDVAVGAVFFGAFQTLLIFKNMPVEHVTIAITVAAILFALIDLARLGPTSDDDPAPAPAPNPAPDPQ